MTKLKKAILIGAIVIGVGATSSTVLAASNYNTPLEALAGITGKTVESIMTERAETGKSFGAIANDAGKLVEFQDELVEMQKDTLTQKVEAGVLTQEEADRIITNIETNQTYCNGSGYGYGNGYGRGRGMMGAGFGRGQGGCGGLGYAGYNQAQ